MDLTLLIIYGLSLILHPFIARPLIGITIVKLKIYREGILVSVAMVIIAALSLIFKLRTGDPVLDAALYSFALLCLWYLIWSVKYHGKNFLGIIFTVIIPFFIIIQYIIVFYLVLAFFSPDLLK